MKGFRLYYYPKMSVSIFKVCFYADSLETTNSEISWTWNTALYLCISSFSRKMNHSEYWTEFLEFITQMNILLDSVDNLDGSLYLNNPHKVIDAKIESRTK